MPCLISCRLALPHNADGSLDSSFGTGGQVTTEVSGIDQAFALAVQADGELVAAGIRRADAHRGRRI